MRQIQTSLFSCPSLGLALGLALVASTGCSGGEGGPGSIDGCAGVFFADSDGDGYGDPASSTSGCEQPTGYVDNADDCNDNAADARPGGSEVCDGLDNDCNGLTDTADPLIDLATQRAYYRDADGDGYGDSTDSVVSCDKPAGYVIDDSDCDDFEAARHPDAIEICDSLDNDCDSLIDSDDDSLDDSSAGTYYVDADLDGHGAGPAVVSCSQPFGYADKSGDCDDDDKTTFPGAIELCDNADNDCDGGVDGSAAAPFQCDGLEGVYTGSYQHSAEEKLGSTVINSMKCTSGTSAITVDFDQAPALQGDLSCTYSGGLGGFDSTQSATVLASIALDGTVTGTLTHVYDNFDLERTYSFTGSMVGGTLEIIGTGGMKPNPMSAVPWEVNFSVIAD